VIDLNSVVIGVEAMLRRLIGEDIELRTVKRTALSRIKADPGQIEQVIMNLAVNARDAMPSGGKLTIETADVRLDERQASQHDSVSPGQWVMLSVSDSGIGMDEATRARIFEPFFTTKPLGKGTGLGLSTVYGIVKQSGGSVWVDSKLGHGTTFKIYLPPVEGIAELAAAEPQHAPIGSETILLVEDEDGVRALAQKCLERSGYQVLTARHGLEALDVAEGHANPIHLLLTDIVMPHMGGRKLAERLAPQRREMQVLFTSGYTDDAIVHHGVLEPGTELLQKPFTPDALLRRVRAVLDAARERA
jgi:CheY-like chemotaxis protein